MVAMCRATEYICYNTCLLGNYIIASVLLSFFDATTFASFPC